VLLDWGVDLALPISRQTIVGKTAFSVGGNGLAACLDTSVNEDFVKQLAAHQLLGVVFRDTRFSSDSVKIKVEQVFKLLSPATEIKTL
jgi:adenine-specific DNA-methyltransferase